MLLVGLCKLEQSGVRRPKPSLLTAQIHHQLEFISNRSPRNYRSTHTSASSTESSFQTLVEHCVDRGDYQGRWTPINLQ